MAVRQLKIFLHVLNISQGSTVFSETTVYLDKGKICYVAIAIIIFSHVKKHMCYFHT